MKDGKIMENATEENQYYKWYDGWFTYYVNVKTSKKKFVLEEGDVEVSHETDDFIYEEK